MLPRLVRARFCLAAQTQRPILLPHADFLGSSALGAVGGLALILSVQSFGTVRAQARARREANQEQRLRERVEGLIQLKRRHAIQDGDRRAAEPAWNDTGLVCTTMFGTPIEPSNLRRTFAKDIATAGVRRIRFHDMRHTCASLLLSQGVQMRVVMEILGHSHMAITSDIYSHVAPATLKSASAAMNSALDARGPSLNQPLSCADVRRRAWALLSAVAVSVAVNRAENHT